jgi:signal transduction histidine kinase
MTQNTLADPSAADPAQTRRLPEDQRRIFQVFRRLHGEDAYPGTGVGLAIVSKAVRAMGGRVEVSSALGRGSAFSVRLSAAPAGEEN